MRWLAYLMVLLSGLLVGSSLAAQPYSQLHYTTDNGLPSNETFSVVQDREGYIWVGTDKGITRFDGHTFKTYNNIDGLRSTVIFKLLPSPIGGIVFYGADNHVGMIQHDSIFYIDNDANSHVNSIYASPTGPVVSYRGKSKYILYNWQGQKVKEREYTGPGYLIDNKELGFISLGDLNEDRSPGTYIGANGIEIPLKEIHTLVYRNHTLISSMKFRAISSGATLSTFTDPKMVSHFTLSGISTSGSFIDADGQLWIGLFDRGVSVFDTSDTSLRLRLLEGFSVSSIFQDKEGNMWLTTLKNGLIKLRKSYYEPIYRDNIHRMLEFKEQLAACSGDTTLLLYDFDTRQITKTHVRSEIKDLLTINDTLFVSTKYELSKLPVLNRIRYLYAANSSLGKYRNQPVWIFENNLGFAKGGKLFDQNVDFLERGYTYVTRVYDDTIYTGKSRGLYKVYRQDGRFVSNKLLSTPVTSMARGNNGSLVLGTKGHGLIFTSKNFSIRAKYSTADGLTGNFVSFVEYMGDTLICGTNKGLNFIIQSSASDEPHIFSSFASEGLWSSNITDIVIKKQHLFVSTDKGIQKIHLSHITRSLANPKPIIEHLNGVVTRPSKLIKVAKGTRAIKVGLNTIFFHKTRNYLSEYRLLGRDTQWVPTTTSELEFFNLSPGEYEVQFRTKLPDNATFSMASLQFELMPRFVQTIWFRLGLATSLAGMAMILLYLRERRAREKNRMLLYQEQLRFKTLTSQLNPHFIFNALGSIQNLIITQKNDLAAEYLASFSGLLDKTLRNTNELFIPLADEMAFIEEYVGIERSRYEKPLELKWHLAKGFSPIAILVPTMFLQPYIENSIIHGINPLNRDGKIDVYIRVTKPGVLEIRIIDNGIGVEKSKQQKRRKARKSMAMENIKSRILAMEALYRDKFSQRIEEITNDDSKVLGTEVIVTIPYKTR